MFSSYGSTSSNMFSQAQLSSLLGIHGDAHTKKQQLEENDKCKKWVATSEKGQ
jgi:hypothetical protein